MSDPREHPDYPRACQHWRHTLPNAPEEVIEAKAVRHIEWREQQHLEGSPIPSAEHAAPEKIEDARNREIHSAALSLRKIEQVIAPEMAKQLGQLQHEITVTRLQEMADAAAEREQAGRLCQHLEAVLAGESVRALERERRLRESYQQARAEVKIGLKIAAAWAAFVFLVLVLLLAFSVKAHAQFSHINTITLQNNDGTTAAFLASPFTMKVGVNCTWVFASQVATINCTGGAGGAGGSNSQVQWNSANALAGISTLTTDGTVNTAKAGTNWNFVDPVDTTKKVQFDASNVATATTRTMNIPNANATFAQAVTAVAHQWLTAMSAQGVFAATQPASTDLGDFSTTVPVTSGKIPIYDSTAPNAAGGTGAYVPGDPLVQGTQAAGSTTIPNPVVIGGSDYSGTPAVRSLKVDASGNGFVTFSNSTIGVTGTFWQATQPVSGTFWQATQPVSIATMPSTPVTGTFWQATQPVSGTFWQATQPVAGTLTDNNAAPAATNEGVLAGIARTDYRGGTAATAGRLVAPDVGTDGLLHVAALPDTSIKRYRASSKFAASSTTDNWRISGNASNTVLVTWLSLTCTQTTAGQVNVEVVKRSVADSGGTAGTPTIVPMDSNKAAGSSVVNSYTGTGPTVGAAVGDVDNGQVGCMAAATATPNDIYIGNFRTAPIVLRGTAEGLAINLGGAITGGNVTVTVEWMEITTITP